MAIPYPPPHLLLGNKSPYMLQPMGSCGYLGVEGKAITIALSASQPSVWIAWADMPPSEAFWEEVIVSSQCTRGSGRNNHVFCQGSAVAISYMFLMYEVSPLECLQFPGLNPPAALPPINITLLHLYSDTYRLHLHPHGRIGVLKECSHKVTGARYRHSSTTYCDLSCFHLH